MELTLSDALADYIAQRKQTKLEPLQKARDKILEKTQDPIEIATANREYAEAAAPIEADFNPVNWLTDAAKRAKQISLATHAAKFTHSDAKASSILVSVTNLESYGYLTTASLPDKAIDAVGNAAALDVAKLLKITINGENLIQQLQAQHVDALTAFTQDTELLKEWQLGFARALADEKLTGHTLTKQLYFPVSTALNGDESQHYHLLCPLFSSSLAHELYHHVTSTRFGDEPKAIREARKKGHYHASLEKIFPATAVQNFGGSKPQNISQLNSERYGQSFLLNCAPPHYQTQSKPPLTSASIFSRQLRFKTAGFIREFKAFLAGLTAQENNFKARYQRDYGFVLPIIDVLLNEAAIIQNMTEFAGWATSAECQLKTAHGLWLDVANPEPRFQQERAKGDWQEIIANDFATWLLAQLQNKERYVLGDIEHQYVKKLCLVQLKTFERHTPKHREA
ncbi:MAG: type I-F CRISPR-associated protein Csy1 [Gammaproteobacteria bacterium]|nr:type I-F CRISPR-associated protein Csy1 [Gammaproteobacteria bacterium]MBU1479767.1 type I-F CRISPR-associated protein Csy1 [Gammaproteobacteria bacterium]MBU2002790.1 type I-F CRISPR-associated protein Csy1 [Gammaproteobacteria bacterium]MBU2131177.1 type I-F CRISPR-associated protein Csy1 [Gammaproteobacteria bacterium]MBU2186853.1 type I-F CRISPR-associated protein Csy1 [Gammaproteobacteria bacterium]